MLAQELNPQMYSPCAQPQPKGSQRYWEGGGQSPSTLVPLGDWQVDTNPNTHRQTQAQGDENRYCERITVCPDGHLNIWLRHPEVQMEAPLQPPKLP